MARVVADEQKKGGKKFALLIPDPLMEWLVAATSSARELTLIYHANFSKYYVRRAAICCTQLY